MERFSSTLSLQSWTEWQQSPTLCQLTRGWFGESRPQRLSRGLVPGFQLLEDQQPA